MLILHNSIFERLEHYSRLYPLSLRSTFLERAVSVLDLTVVRVRSCLYDRRACQLSLSVRQSDLGTKITAFLSDYFISSPLWSRTLVWDFTGSLAKQNGTNETLHGIYRKCSISRVNY